MAGKLRKFFALSAGDKQQLLLAAFWLPLTHFRLRCFGLQSCLRVLGGKDDIGAVRQEALDAGQYGQALACERSVAWVSRHGPVAGTCLSRSLTVMRLLARRKLAGRLFVGVKLDNGALEAHAWVEVAGISLGQGEHSYEVFHPLPH